MLSMEVEILLGMPEKENREPHNGRSRRRALAHTLPYLCTNIWVAQKGK